MAPTVRPVIVYPPKSENRALKSKESTPYRMKKDGGAAESQLPAAPTITIRPLWQRPGCQDFGISLAGTILPSFTTYAQIRTEAGSRSPVSVNLWLAATPWPV